MSTNWHVGDRVIVHGDSCDDNMLGTVVGNAVYCDPLNNQRPAVHVEYIVNLDESFQLGGLPENLTVVHRDGMSEAPWYVNVYELDRGWGGPEEGGWWYDVGIPTFSVRAMDEKMAAERAGRLRLLYSDESEYPLSSVCYNGGEYAVIVQNHPPRAWPDERPFYE